MIGIITDIILIITIIITQGTITDLYSRESYRHQTEVIMAEGSKKLWQSLKEDGLYTKSYEEFTKQFSTTHKLYSLYTMMKSDGYYTKTMADFKQQYWDLQPAPRNRIKIEDTREIDRVTGESLPATKRLNVEADSELIKKIVKKAGDFGIDPYTALAIAHQETGFSDEYYGNPMNLLSGGRLNPETAEEDFLDLTMLTMQDKIKMAERLGKKTDEEIIQAWNGYGKISSESFGGKVKKVYGIDVSKNPIDMSKNPVYGKRVVDIRENIIKKNPEIKKIVEENVVKKDFL